MSNVLFCLEIQGPPGVREGAPGETFALGHTRPHCSGGEIEIFYILRQDFLQNVFFKK